MLQSVILIKRLSVSRVTRSFCNALGNNDYYNLHLVQKRFLLLVISQKNLLQNIITVVKNNDFFNVDDINDIYIFIKFCSTKIVNKRGGFTKYFTVIA